MIILVDFENTHASGLEGYTYLNESDTLVMYYSDENSAVTKGVVDDLRKNGVHVRLVKLLKQHSNALDMYIASTTGMFLDSGEKICIVSKDHGYAAVRDFWHSLRGAEILLGETIKQCLLSSELNDEARIRLCKEREQKAMLVDAFTTMNTIPTRPTLSRSNQRRRRNDTRNFMEVSEPVAILPNPLMTETPADQLAKELSSAAAKSENTAREAQPDSAALQETVMITSVSSDNASSDAPVSEVEASTATGRGERGGRGRNGRNRRNDQNYRNERNDRPERDDRNAQDRSDTTAAEKTGSEQRAGRDADARTQNTLSTREQSGNRRELSSPAEQNTASEPAQERFGGYDGIMKMNEASRIALDQRQEREEQKAEQNEPSAAKNRNHSKQNAQPVSDEKQRTSENRKKEEKQHTSGNVTLDATSGTALTQAKQETAALVKTEKKTTAVAKLDPNRVQFVWDPVTRSMKRVGGPAEESTEKKDDAAKAEAAEKNAEVVDKKTADRQSEKDAAADAEKNQGAASTKTTDVSDDVAVKDAAEEEKRVADVTAQASDVAVETAPDAAVEKNAEAKDNVANLAGAAEKNVEAASIADASPAKTDVATTEAAVAETVTDAVIEKTVADPSKSEDVKKPAAEITAVQPETVPEKTVATDITAHPVTAEHAQAGQPAVTDEKKSEATKKTGAHRKAKKSTSVKKESNASEKPVDAKKSASSSKPEGKKKADAVKHEKDSERNSGASETKATQNTANASEKPEINTENTASASKKETKKTSAKKSAKKDAKKESAEQKSDADAKDAQPILEMTEEDIQLTKKKYSEGINTLHTYYVRLMKAFGREQGRAIYESTKKSVQEDIKARKAQLAAQPTTTEVEDN